MFTWALSASDVQILTLEELDARCWLEGGPSLFHSLKGGRNGGRILLTCNASSDGVTVISLSAFIKFRFEFWYTKARLECDFH